MLFFKLNIIILLLIFLILKRYVHAWTKNRKLTNSAEKYFRTSGGKAKDVIKYSEIEEEFRSIYNTTERLTLSTKGNTNTITSPEIYFEGLD